MFKGNVHRAGFAVRVAAILILMVASLGVSPASAAGKGDGIGKPMFKTENGVTNFSATAITIPYFRSSFIDPTNGVTYPYTMVGSDPSAGAVSTTIPTVIIPLSFTFDASTDSAFHTLDGTARVTDTVNSPVFQNADIGASANVTASTPPAGVAPDPRIVNEPSDVTQLGDAIYRAQWGKTGTGYHVLLGQPTVLPTVSFNVPKNQGFILVGSVSHSHIGLMSYSWFSSRLKNTLSNLKISPQVLPIFLVNNVFLYIGNTSNCCVLGYHGANSSLNGNGKQQVNTYMFASYSDPNIFAPNDGDAISYIQDIHGLSHEVQEWYDDPFVNNIINPWLTPTAPQYGCTAYLETGDPVVGYGWTISLNGKDYHPEDEVHYSWFARESSSRAAQGYLTYLNNYAGIAQGCQ